MSDILSVFVVHDDPISNFLTTKVIEKSKVETEVQVFEEALGLINNLKDHKVDFPDLIFIDLNMPKINGWQFIELFNELDFEDAEKVDLVILSSSNNTDDILRASKLSQVKKYITKPLTIAVMQSLCHEIKSPIAHFE